MNQEEKHS